MNHVVVYSQKLAANSALFACSPISIGLAFSFRYMYRSPFCHAARLFDLVFYWSMQLKSLTETLLTRSFLAPDTKAEILKSRPVQAQILMIMMCMQLGLTFLSISMTMQAMYIAYRLQLSLPPADNFLLVPVQSLLPRTAEVSKTDSQQHMLLPGAHDLHMKYDH